jgi:beta-lactamase class A
MRMTRQVFCVSRRAVLAGATLFLPALPASAADMDALAALEKRSGARIGLAALDTGSGRTIAWRARERFVMCSTFKLSLAAAILARVDKGREKLDRLIHYDKNVPIGHSPATVKNVDRGMTVAQLCEAAIIYSDNGAANLLLAAMGGPQALTGYWRSIGDSYTRLDNNEPTLNTPDGIRNTTTPAAMMSDMKIWLLGAVLSPASRAQLLAWMRENTTGANRLHAGLPAGWQLGDKTGTGPKRFGLVNDIGIIFPPGRKPIIAALYTERGDEKVLAAASKILAATFA